MSTIHKPIFAILFLSYIGVGFSEEYSGETKLGSHYLEIFRNIPSLFEYFLDVLEQRIEVLESNDLDAYEEQTYNENKVKRDADYQSTDNKEPVDDDDGENSNAVFKRSTAMNDDDSKLQLKRETPSTVDAVSEIHEYGRSSGRTSKYFGTKDNTNGKKQEKSTSVVGKQTFNKKEVNSKTLRGHDLKSVVRKVSNNHMGVIKRNVIHYGDGYVGSIDWTKFYLSPEEVEEKSVKTEQMIEEYNKKNKKK